MQVPAEPRATSHELRALRGPGGSSPLVARGSKLLSWAALCVVCLGALAGCTSLLERAKNPFLFAGLYLLDRVEDALEVVDVGVTVSEEPGVAFYGSFASLTPVGVGYVDGHFVGLGGGQLLGLGTRTPGRTRFYLSAVGMLAWGYEELGWQTFDPKNLASLHCQDVGLPGMLTPPHGRPGPAPS
ncbi:MAG: hypothetical protein FJ291_19195 [Planctomycetes bacterium]|nr:hypothetical protein [Planctomycetota bacterium]